MKLNKTLWGTAFLVLSACMADYDGGINIEPNLFDFSQSQHGWSGGFADYPAGENDSSFYELQFEYTQLPEGFPPQNAIKVSGNNHSDDLFMYLKKKVTGLEPDTEYIVTFEVMLASEAKQGSVGIGGSPGESVYLKVGATDTEPKSVIDNGQYVMNIDIGSQSQGGEDMITIGNIAVPETADGYEMLVRSNTGYNNSSAYDQPFVVRSNSQGELWLIVGTDSGFEGVTTIYYMSITTVFTKSS